MAKSNLLKQFAERLRNTGALRFHVQDARSLNTNYIDRGIGQERLDADFDGDLSVYLKTLRDRGYGSVQLVPYLKNGSGRKNANMASITVNLDGTKQQPPTDMGLGQPTGLLGLSVPEIFQMSNRANSADKLETEKERLERKLEAAEEKLRKSEEDSRDLQRKLDIIEFSKPSGISQVLEILQKNPQLINTGLAAISGGGLNAPVAQPQQRDGGDDELNQYARVVVDTMREWPEELCQRIFAVCQRYSQDDRAFVEKLEAMLNPKLKKVAGDE